MKPTARGWKCFDADLKCLDFQFEIGGTYEIATPPVMRSRGFHFHENPGDLFKYYNASSRVCEVTAFDVITGSDKSVCRKITIGPEIVGFAWLN